MTHTHKFPSSEDIDDNICDDDTVEGIKYIGTTEVVTCSKEDGQEYSEEELHNLPRGELHGIGKEVGANTEWTGENADSKNTMIVKILEALEE